jgi:hypothetical protein
MQTHEEELKQLLSQIEPERRTRKFVGAWLRAKQAEKPIQEYPEIA